MIIYELFSDKKKKQFRVIQHEKPEHICQLLIRENPGRYYKDKKDVPNEIDRVEKLQTQSTYPKITNPDSMTSLVATNKMAEIENEDVKSSINNHDKHSSQIQYEPPQFSIEDGKKEELLLYGRKYKHLGVKVAVRDSLDTLRQTISEFVNEQNKRYNLSNIS